MNKVMKFRVVAVALLTCTVMTACGNSNKFNKHEECWNCGATPTMSYTNAFGEDMYICESCYNEFGKDLGL